MKFSAIKPLGLKYLPGIAGAFSALALAGCMGFGSTGGGILPVGLTAPMDVPGAQLDRVQSLGLVNQYRASTGVAPLAADSGLDASAQLLATQYANTGTAPKQPGGIVAVRYSAGYQNFAETFSGWRNSAADAAILANGAATRAGVAVAHNPNSAYGVYWVLILGN